jgi:hypothetical protein
MRQAFLFKGKNYFRASTSGRFWVGKGETVNELLRGYDHQSPFVPVVHS